MPPTLVFSVMRATMRITMRVSREPSEGFFRPGPPTLPRRTKDGPSFNERSCRSSDGGARRAARRTAQKIVFLSELTQQAQKFVTLFHREGSHRPFLRLGDSALRRRREAQSLGGDFDQLGAPVVFRRTGGCQSPLFEVLYHDRDRRAVERHDAADRRLVHRAKGRESGQSHILERRKVERLTFIEEDGDRDLMASAQQMPGRREVGLGRFEVRRIVNFGQRRLTYPVRGGRCTYAHTTAYSTIASSVGIEVPASIPVERSASALGRSPHGPCMTAICASRLVTRHVLRAVDSLEHKHVEDIRILDLLVHGSKLRREIAGASNASFESIDLRPIRISNRSEG